MDVVSVFGSVPARYPELQGKVALVTGSGRGIGRGIAVRLVREGMKVVVTARSADQVAATAAGLREVGGEVLDVVADLGQRADVDRLSDTVLDAWGGVDLLVNNAAYMRRGSFWDTDDRQWQQAWAVIVDATRHLSRRVATGMRERGHGCIVNISTVGALRAHNQGLPYDAAKAALDGITRCLGTELIAHGIRVNGVAPGATHTSLVPPSAAPPQRLIPIRRMGVDLEMAAVVAFLASDDASYIVGQTIYVDGGMTTQLSPPDYPV